MIKYEEKKSPVEKEAVGWSGNKLTSSYRGDSAQNLKSVENDVIFEVKANLALLEDLHARFRYMLKEITRIVEKN